MAEVKISIIGAGSAVFSLNLVKDLCLTPNLQGSTISFMDINKERLDAVYALAKRYAEEMGIKLKLEKTSDRLESLHDANFVINTALVSGYENMRECWSIGFKHGYRLGGSYHIMHDESFYINFYQLRFFESLINDILDVCPDAWYIKLANPVLQGITYLKRKYPEAKLVGLCHGFNGIYHVTNILGLERELVSFQISGVNHFVWLKHFYYKGQNAFPLLDKWIEKEAPKHWEKSRPSSDTGPKAIDLYKKLGMFPIGDTCTPGGGAWPWWYHKDDETEKKWREDPKKWWETYFPTREQRLRELIKTSQDPSTKVTSIFAPKKTSEIIVPLVESIACDIPRIFQVNILNDGSFVPGVPRDFEVEVPGRVSKRGVQGIETSGLSKPIISYILRDRVAPVEVELEAYESGNRSLLLQLILMDPWTKSEEQAKNLLEDLVALPYHKGMRQYYR